MSSAKEIRTKIKSIKNTQKITRAMEMVAASKMRKAQQSMLAARPYAQHIRRVAHHLATSSSEYVHPYLQKRIVKRAVFIVVSTDRGLCGGLNGNLFRQVLQKAQTLNAAGVGVDIVSLGSKADSFFKRFGFTLRASVGRLGDVPQMADLLGAIRVALTAYQTGEVDTVYLAYNQFVNTVVQKPVIDDLVPLESEDLTVEETPGFNWDYLYEPDPKMLLDVLLNRFVESQIYHSVVENYACEQAARMVAMKNASDNAGDLIGAFQLAYNKARQAAITRELSEIVAGADAV